MATTFAARLKELREAAGISQADLAFKAGMHPQSVAKLEQGDRDPGFFTAKALAEALGVGVEAFADTVPSQGGEPSPGPGRPPKGGTGKPAESAEKPATPPAVPKKKPRPKSCAA